MGKHIIRTIDLTKKKNGRPIVTDQKVSIDIKYGKKKEVILKEWRNE